MKKIFLFIFCLIVLLVSDYQKASATNDVLDIQTKKLNDLMPFWENMYNCNKYEKSILSNNGKYTFYYKVLGIEKNYCHVIIPEFNLDNCYFPLDVNKKIADLKIKSYKELLYKIKNEQKYSYNTNNSIDNYIQTMSAKYCKY